MRRYQTDRYGMIASFDIAEDGEERLANALGEARRARVLVFLGPHGAERLRRLQTTRKNRESRFGHCRALFRRRGIGLRTPR